MTLTTLDWTAFIMPMAEVCDLCSAKRKKLNLRLDYGLAKHSNALNVQLREAF